MSRLIELTPKTTSFNNIATSEMEQNLINTLKKSSANVDDVFRDLNEIQKDFTRLKELYQAYQQGKLDPYYTKQLIEDLLVDISSLCQHAAEKGVAITDELRTIQSYLDSSSFIPASVKEGLANAMNLLTKFSDYSTHGLQDLAKIAQKLINLIEKSYTETKEIADGVVSFLDSVDNILAKLNIVLDAVDTNLKHVADKIRDKHPKIADAIDWIDGKIVKLNHALYSAEDLVQKGIKTVKLFFHNWL